MLRPPGGLLRGRAEAESAVARLHATIRFAEVRCGRMEDKRLRHFRRSGQQELVWLPGRNQSGMGHVATAGPSCIDREVESSQQVAFCRREETGTGMFSD